MKKESFMIIYFLSNLLVLYDLLTDRNARGLGYALELYFSLPFTPLPNLPLAETKRRGNNYE